jgi:hypothetical protein
MNFKAESENITADQVTLHLIEEISAQHKRNL